MNPEQDKQGTSQDNADAPEGDRPNQNDVMPTVGDTDRSKKKMWLWIIIILLLLLALLFGWWWMSKDKKEPAASTDSTAPRASSEEKKEETKTVTCTDGYTEYNNTELGFGFCYPTTWGMVSVADGKFAPGDTGQRWLIHFARKSMVNLGVVTADWSTEEARDGTCVDPAVQTLPAFSPFSTTWDTEGTPVMSATRGIEVLADSYLINEETDDLLTSGACLHGYTIIDADPYTHTSASYSADFGGGVTTPQQHIDNPLVLIPAADRVDFTTFVKSVHAL
ncbi:MAG TPA: hypothetical protein VFB59_04040 [Candidatus Saccharimonadales bacterium]|nr:hypothetical protein [Candidatus Saccharimonadales bacterium]